MTTAARILTGAPDGFKPLENIASKLEKIPYEQFPYCCSDQNLTSDSKVKEVDLSGVKRKKGVNNGYIE